MAGPHPEGPPIAILWRYVVRPEARADFERVYAPAGRWSALFARAEGYLGTELYRGPADTYLTIDRWRTEADFTAFLTAYREEYEALDRETEGWTMGEVKLGVWEEVADEPAISSPIDGSCY